MPQRPRQRHVRIHKGQGLGSIDECRALGEAYLFVDSLFIEEIRFWASSNFSATLDRAVLEPGLRLGPQGWLYSASVMNSISDSWLQSLAPRQRHMFWLSRASGP